MVPLAVAEQQAKLGVSAEESKAQRLKRQQARFRDRGGVFVPATTNPLVDILLARTVSGESPTKAFSRDAPARRVSPRKPRQTSPTRRATTAQENQKAGSSKAKKAPSRKGKEKAVGLTAEPVAEPPKGRATKKGRKKTEDRGSDAEQLLPTSTITKPQPASKGKGKQQPAAPSTSEGDPKPKPKPKASAKTKPTKVVLEVFDSDEDQTLVEVPRKIRPVSEKKTQHEEDSESDDDAPIIKKQAKRRIGGSGTKTVSHVKTEKIVAPSVNETDNGEERTQTEKCSTPKDKKRTVRRYNDDEGVGVPVPPTKKRKKTAAMKPNTALEPDPAPHPIIECAKSATRRVKVEPDRNFADAEQDEPLPKPGRKKRKKEEDNYDDRPRKVVKFAETGIFHPSSGKLKENQSDKKRERAPKPSTINEAGALWPRLSTNPPRAKTPKGPPLEVLQRIKASAARHLRSVDSEPDELDCLS